MKIKPVIGWEIYGASVVAPFSPLKVWIGFGQLSATVADERFQNLLRKGELNDRAGKKRVGETLMEVPDGTLGRR